MDRALDKTDHAADRLLSVARAAKRLGVSKNTAYRMARDNQLPGLVQLAGRRLRVRQAVLEDWLRRQ